MAVAGFIAIIALGMGIKNLKSRLNMLEILAFGLVAWPLVKLGSVNAPSELTATSHGCPCSLGQWSFRQRHFVTMKKAH